MSDKYKYVKASIHRRRLWINSLKDNPCARCGVKYPPYVMDFHHRNPEEKKFQIGGGSFRHGREKTLKEIKKCDLLCANCHREVEHQLRDGVTVTYLSHKQRL